MLHFFFENTFLLFNKPRNISSGELLEKIKNILINNLGQNYTKYKIGHAGTLDPLAEGLLIVCFGDFTKHLEIFKNLQKKYITTIDLSISTNSYDLETEIVNKFDLRHINKEDINKSLKEMIRIQKQIPPNYSAKWVKGKRAFNLARDGQEFELDSNEIEITKIELLEFNLPNITIEIECSKGTYVRSISRDLGYKLNAGNCITYLKREEIGWYNLNNALTLDKFSYLVERLKELI